MQTKAPNARTGGELDVVLAEITELLGNACALPREELEQLAEAVFLVGARFGAGWAEHSGGEHS